MCTSVPVRSSGPDWGVAAKGALTRAGGTGKFTAKYYDLSCPGDGIQIGAGTTYGNGAVTVTDQDEHRLVLTAEGNRKQVEARLTKRAEEAGLRSRSIKTRMNKLAPRGLAPSSLGNYSSH